MIYIYPTHIGKLTMKITKFKIVDQHMNATSHMSSWKWTIFGSINSFYCVFTQGLQNVLLPCEQHGMFCITNTTSQEGFRHCFERIFKIIDSIPWLVFEIYNSSMLKISPCV